MDKKSKQQLGELILNHDDLLHALSNSTSLLSNYPDLQQHLLEKNQKSIEYRKAIRNKCFTKEDYKTAILERLDWIGYELCQQIDMSFIINRVATIAGSDFERIKTLSIEDFGAENISRLMSMLAIETYSRNDLKPAYPFLATKGQVAHEFWKRADKAYDAFAEGYTSHFKLNAWSKDNLDCPSPQSATRFFKMYGDPRNIPEWQEYKDQ